MKRLSLIFIPIVGISLSGCGVVAQKALQDVAKQVSSGSRGRPADAAYTASLTANPKSGPGVVVFDPVVDSSTKTEADLATGMGRYLHFYVAGQGEFGKTTTLGHMDEVRRQYKLGSWEVAIPKNQSGFKTVRKYVKSLGATFYAVGKLEKQNGILQLTYAMYPLNNDKRVGIWLLKEPSKTDLGNNMVSQLPALVGEMATAAGAKSPAIPKKIALTNADLKQIGSVPFLQKRQADQITPALGNKLRALASRDALAAVLTIRLRACPTPQDGLILAENAVKLAPNNSLALSEPASAQFNSKITDTISPQIDAFLKKFPNNALANHTAFWRAINKGDATSEIDYEEDAVKSAPDNAYFWRYLSVAHANSADIIRQGRFFNQLSGDERENLDASYTRALGASERATTLDPGYSFGWSRLSTDSTFVGDSNTAFSSLEKALEIDDTNEYAWGWGQQLNQPKWFGSIAQFTDYEKRSANYANHFHFFVRDMIAVLKSSSQRKDVRDILEVVIKKDPTNFAAFSELGQYYHYDEANYPRAEALYKQALAINPKDGRTNSAYGDLTYWTKHDTKTAEKFYLKAITFHPNDGYYYGNYARMLALAGRKSEAVQMAQKAKQLGLDRNHPVWEATGVTPP